MTTPYQEGFRSYDEGKKLEQNPYSPLTEDEHAAWRRGWLDHLDHDVSMSITLDSIGWFGT